MFNNILVALLIALAIGNSAHADITTGPVVDYQFQNTLSSSYGNVPTLNILGTNEFTIEEVDSIDRMVSVFPQGSGFVLTPTTNITTNDTYTIVFLARLTTITGYRKYVDFKNRASDQGLYNLNGKLTFFSFATGLTAPIIANYYRQIVITRDGNTKTVVGYVDGVQQFNFIDTSNAGVISTTNSLHFFIDDTATTATSAEHSAGAVARIRIFDNVLTPTEVAALDHIANTLVISQSGTGNGTITSNPSGINCGSDCSENYPSGSNVTLTATPATDSTFNGFSGDADCSDGTVTMNAEKHCTATFNIAITAPTAITNAASNIAQTSATLNGQVSSSNATATVSFDFGTTTNFGQTITATPSQIYSNSPITVAATSTELTCNNLYFFRTKAVNSVGTSYGVNQGFKTAACNTNGICGSSNNNSFNTAPTANLCSVGTASAVSGTGPWNWTCAGSNGGTNANCTANINRYTATATAVSGGTVDTSSVTVNYGTPASFTVTADNGYTHNNAVTGTCASGTWNGNVWTTGAITANCSVNFDFTLVPQPSNGVCGSANGGIFSTIPTENLCSSGTASAVTGSGPWNWTCTGSNGGTNANCTANSNTPINTWLYPITTTITLNKPFTLDLIAKSSGVQIGRYEFAITYDPAKLRLDTSFCNQGVCNGTNALSNNVVDVNTTAGTINIIGQGGETAAGNDLQLLIIHLKTRLVYGTTPVGLTTIKLATLDGDTIGLGARGAIINISPGLCGDADGNATVNIIDALAIARDVVGLPPPPTVEMTLADVNKNGRADINDALMIARYAVGLVLPPEVCNIGQAL